MLQRVPELWLLDQTIHNVHIISLSLECAKHAIPDDQHCSIILVQAVSIGAMMHLMIVLSRDSNVSLVTPCGGWRC